MPQITEPTIQESLWKWLEENGNQVAGEVTLPDIGIIDLIAYDPMTDEYMGIEVKNSTDTDGDESRFAHESAIVGHNETKQTTKMVESAPWEQLAKYQHAGCLDRLYLASQRAGYALNGNTTRHADKIYGPYSGSPTDVGAICVPGIFAVDEIEIISEAETLSRKWEPSFSTRNEAWVQHYVWEHLGGIREAVLPNRESKIPRRVDVMTFSNSSDPTTVYHNQSENAIIGVEAKGANGLDNEASVRTQLRRYVESGALTKLFFAAPAADSERAEEILMSNELAEVGLYVVDDSGNVSCIREADKLRLKYDGLRTKNGDVVDIGWGKHGGPKKKSNADYVSLFDMCS